MTIRSAGIGVASEVRDQQPHHRTHHTNMTDDLIEAHGSCAKLMPTCTCRVQFRPQNTILKAMKPQAQPLPRAICGLIETMSDAARPEYPAFRHFIGGSPARTEADFADTLALVRGGGLRRGVIPLITIHPSRATPLRSALKVDEEVKAERLAPPSALLLSASAAAGAGRSWLGKGSVGSFRKRAGRLPGKSGGKVRAICTRSRRRRPAALLGRDLRGVADRRKRVPIRWAAFSEG